MPNKPKSKQRPWIAKSKVQSSKGWSGNGFYSSTRWRNLRKQHLMLHPLCVLCQNDNTLTLAKVVDHIIPISKGGAALDMSNLQSLCERHHNQKSGRESKSKGGMG